MSYKKTQKDYSAKFRKKYMIKMRLKIEMIKKNKTESLELNNSINEMKNAIESIFSRAE